MKIAQVCPYDFSRPGGVKNHIICLSEELKKLGHEVKIITPAATKDYQEIEAYPFGKNRALNIAGTRIDINVALGNERKLLKEFMVKEDFDIIHYHTFWNPALPFQVWNNSKAKNIVTFHDTPKSKLVGKTIMPIAAKFIFKMMDKVISVSKSQARYISGINHKKVSVIPNGIDTSHYQSRVPKLKAYDDGKFNLLFLGRLEPRKGILYALEAFLRLKNENNNLRLIIAGDGQEKSLAETFIKDHQLTDVIMSGQISDSAKYTLLQSADLYLATAIYGESFGIVLLEAMAAGLPMTGFANEGYMNIIPEEWEMCFVKPKDLDGLTTSIKRMIENPELRQEMKKWGLKEVKRYAWDKIGKQIEQLYFSTLK